MEDEAGEVGRSQVMEDFMGLDFTKIIMATIYGVCNDALTH